MREGAFRPSRLTKEGVDEEETLAAAAVASFAAVAILPSASAHDARSRRHAGRHQGRSSLGGTFPLSGPASGYAPIATGMAVYFKYINAPQGQGRQARRRRSADRLEVLRRRVQPGKRVQLANKLVLEDKVFAIVGTLGTEHNQAIRPFLNQRKVPQLLVSTGASYWGAAVQAVPVDDGLAARLHRGGARLRASGSPRTRPNAKIAVLYQNDDYGKDYLHGAQDRPRREAKPDRLRAVLRGHRHELRLADLARQKASGADTWVLFTTAARRPCARSRRRRR